MSDNNDNINITVSVPRLPWWAPFAKAVVAALIGFLVAFISALLPFVVQGEAISVAGWLTATLAALVSLGASFGVVYATPNVSKK